MKKQDKQFAVIGLGRFGGSICRELHMLGHEVLAIDHDIVKVEEFVPYSTHAIQGNATEEAFLKSIGIRNFDHVIVAIGEDIQASVLTTLNLKEFGVQTVWAKAQNVYHQKLLDKIGADRVIHPEVDMGMRIAQSMASDHLLDYINLSEEYSVIEIRVNQQMHSRTLQDLRIRPKFNITILAIKRENDINVSPLPSEVIYSGDILVAMGLNSNLKRLEDKLM
ncbi:potassium channel family protein [Psychrobacillus lasiicapitis]|uniref:TrkA family potassium uptake protein n=1 Tax=Psychrobacillus lasiicapitis TaxID=1636719 RepID=A0A544SQL3_9BACI|nr:TrkA family potassium uptake protein [Psychrobacillus lasiicapitis]TQR07496.1 TrkA family potassium uptake protein [Psychrobacillus lasiicapitis]GGA50169.1 ktr system potassium uptake protein A [Psychrobacillus lasiicapitis]